MDLVGTRSWSSQSNQVTFVHCFLDDNFDCMSTEIELIEGTTTIEVTNHDDDFWNGLYIRAEDWNGNPHFAKEDRSAHLFHLNGYWQMDHREQDGTRDYYDGGYMQAGDEYETDLIG